MADDFGKRLLAEIEETGLHEVRKRERRKDAFWTFHPSSANKNKQILHSIQLRTHDATKLIPYFGLPALDRILHAVQPPSTATSRPSPPVIELTSLTHGGGSTHLLYHLCATAALPHTSGGKHASAVVVDTDNTFSIPRLAQQLRTQIETQSRRAAVGVGVDVERTLLDSLRHIHVLRPQSATATVAALRALPAYLFDARKHHSIDRALAFVALDSATAFSPGSGGGDHAGDSERLAVALQDIVARQLASPMILTAHFLYPMPVGRSSNQAYVSLRSPLPVALAALPTLRLLVRRSAVRRFPAGISANEARREASDRQRAVDAGRFECMVNEWKMSWAEQTEVREVTGFEFRILREGVVIEDDERADAEAEMEMDGDGRNEV
nr:hypothetical protein CFP56_50797 [Quercus suber]